jgi:UDP-N-acetylmuramoylalanine-D-glutamate ligase
LIAGGATKQLPLPDSLVEKLRTRPVEIMWLAGSGTQEIRPRLGAGETPAYERLDDAVAAAYERAVARRAPIVLFSPGFTSFEHFLNEFDRGEKFNHATRTLPEIEV